MWKEIYNKLTERNLNPHAVGQHLSLTDEPYCIIREGSQIPSQQSRKLGQRVIDVIVFVPLDSYIELNPYVQLIREALKELPYLRKTGHETPAITDDEKKAYTMSIEYVLIKKLEG